MTYQSDPAVYHYAAALAIIIGFILLLGFLHWLDVTAKERARKKRWAKTRAQMKARYKRDWLGNYK